MGRHKKPEALKAKNWTIKVYDWEREPVKRYLKRIRQNMKRIITDEEIKAGKLNTPRTDEEMQEAYSRAFGYDPDDDEVDSHYDDEFDEWLLADELV